MTGRSSRKRGARPWGILAFSGFFLVLPFVNYYLIAMRQKAPWLDFIPILRGAEPVMLAVAVLPVFIALGLLLVTRWGFYLFAAYSVLSILVHSYYAIRYPVLENLAAVGQVVFLLLSLGYFLREEISLPYRDPAHKGWRKTFRLPIRITVHVDDMELKSADFSSTGLSVHWPDCDREPGTAVRLRFQLREKLYDLEGGIARIAGENVGIAFRGLDKKTRRGIEDWMIGRA